SQAQRLTLKGLLVKGKGKWFSIRFDTGIIQIKDSTCRSFYKGVKGKGSATFNMRLQAVEEVSGVGKIAV
ncbi:MAG TPA: hypothetical protein PKX93_04715, partial [bacterium]|nr:hypothetical protein [bacterium]